MAAKPTKPGRQELWGAVSANDLEKVEAALAAGCDPNGAYGGWLPLGRAFRHGTPEIAMALVRGGANLDAREQGRRMLSFAAGDVRWLPVLREMLARGAKPTAGTLRTATRAANPEAMKLLLAAGVDPNDIGPDPQSRKSPALDHWPKRKGPVPDFLLEATYAAGRLSDHLGERLTLATAGHQEKAALDYFMAHAKVSPAIKNDLLHSCLQCHWFTGAIRILDAAYCDPKEHPPSRMFMLGALANGLSHRKTSAKAWELLKRLVDYGYSPNDTNLPLTDGPNANPYPNGFSLLKRVNKDVRPRLLRFLLDHGMETVFLPEDPKATHTTLAHLLVSLRDWRSLAMIDKLCPGTNWEQPGTIPLLACWAFFHSTGKPASTNYPTEFGLTTLLDLASMDINRCDIEGRTGLRYLLMRNDRNMNPFINNGRHSGEMLDQLIRHLIEAGLNPLVADNEGMNDMSIATQSSEVTVPMVADWTTAALERHTKVALDAPKRRPSRL